MLCLYLRIQLVLLYTNRIDSLTSSSVVANLDFKRTESTVLLLCVIHPYINVPYITYIARMYRVHDCVLSSFL